jgi:hypothetical protein
MVARLKGVSVLSSAGSRLHALYDGGSVLRGAMAYRVLPGGIVLGVPLRVVLIGKKIRSRLAASECTKRGLVGPGRDIEEGRRLLLVCRGDLGCDSLGLMVDLAK